MTTVPKGWILMPETPTPEMLAEANDRSLSVDVLMDDTRYACVSAMWKGLVAKRPEPPKKPVSDGIWTAPLNSFGEEIVAELCKSARDYEFEDTAVPGSHMLDRILTIRTPGFVLPEEAREALRLIVRNRAPAAYRITLKFEPAGGR